MDFLRKIRDEFRYMSTLWLIAKFLGKKNGADFVIDHNKKTGEVFSCNFFFFLHVADFVSEIEQISCLKNLHSCSDFVSKKSEQLRRFRV